MTIDINSDNIRRISSGAPLADEAPGFNSAEPLLRYDDRHPWPIKCACCGNEFVEQIRRLKMRSPIRCPFPECQSIIEIDPDFGRALAQARRGSYDPYRDIWGEGR